MTPAIVLLKARNIPHAIHQYEHDSNAASYGQEAADALGLEPERVFKTLLVETEARQLAVAIVPVSSQLNLKACAKALGAKKLVMADPQKAERSTGYVLGGISPLGQKKHLKTVIDQTASAFDTIYVSAGRRGLEVELSASDLVSLLNARLAAICSD